MTDKSYREFQDWFRQDDVEGYLDEKYSNYWPVYELLKKAWAKGYASAKREEPNG